MREFNSLEDLIALDHASGVSLDIALRFASSSRDIENFHNTATVT